MALAARLAFVPFAVAAVPAWGYGPAWLWPWLVGGASLALVVSAVTGRGFSSGGRLRRIGGAVRRVEEGVTDNHGHAAWMTMKEACRRFPGPSPAYGGVVVGEAYRVDQDRQESFEPLHRRTWGKGGRAPLLVDPCMSGPTHSVVFAGSGGFKTTSAVSTILYWRGSSVVLDPSCEVGPMTREALVQSHGKIVCFLDPERPEGAKRWGLNALDWIDPKDPLAEMHVHTVVSWIFGETTGRENEEELFFRKWGRDLVACLIAHLIWTENPSATKTLATVRTAVATPEAEMRKILRGIHTSSNSLMARHIAGSLMDVVHETFSGIYANANQGTSWLSVPAFSDLVSGDAFQTSDLANDRMTVFVQVPLAALLTTPAVARVLIGALLNAVIVADGKGDQMRVLFMLDEAARLGRMKVLETARDAGRKYGITLQLQYQSTGQLEEQWGRAGKRAWYDGVSWRAYAAVQDMETARELSEACGNRGVLAYSEGENTGKQNRLMTFADGSRSKGRNVNVHEIRRALINPDELAQDTRTDELFVIARGCRPLRCGRAIYFRRPEMKGRVNDSRFK
jgi:type IV secretion system protein VirD4